MNHGLKFLFLVSILVFSTGLSAQHFEIGGMLGLSNYSGDLSLNSTKIYMKESGFSGGLFVRYNAHRNINLKLHGNFASVSGSDSNANVESVRRRNLQFQSSIYEIGLDLEINILGFEPYNYNMPFSAYLFGGAAVSFFNPKTIYEGELITLVDLTTENQDSPYKTTAFSIPMGLGFKYALTDRLTLGLEIGGRYMNTDYLDDVSGLYPDANQMINSGNALGAALSNRTAEYAGSDDPDLPQPGDQRGDDKGNDWYFISGITFSYHFLDTGLSNHRRRGKKRKAGCYN